MFASESQFNLSLFPVLCFLPFPRMASTLKEMKHPPQLHQFQGCIGDCESPDPVRDGGENHGHKTKVGCCCTFRTTLKKTWVRKISFLSVVSGSTPGQGSTWKKKQCEAVCYRQWRMARLVDQVHERREIRWGTVKQRGVWMWKYTRSLKIFVLSVMATRNHPLQKKLS